MPKKTTILILILATVTGILLFLAVTENKKSGAPTTTPVPTKKPVEKTAKVFFNPQNIDLSSAAGSAVSTVEILVDTGGSQIAGVQVEAQYDPKSLTSLSLIPAAHSQGFFGSQANILFNEIIPSTGRISFAIAISPDQSPKNGVGKIATLSFQRNFNATSSATIISFLDKTIVTILGENESVLKESVPLNIILSTQTSQPFIPPVYTQ